MILLHGDCLKILPTIESESIDSLVTDPPAGISFMSKGWDSDKGGRTQWIDWLSSVLAECHRVMKPGAHGLIWALPRTSHWTMCAVEDAGFEVRDVITHLFGSGFPKSHDISKAIDRELGAEREVVGKKPGAHMLKSNEFGSKGINGHNPNVDITAPATDAAKQWQGYGTALKPAAEFWILCRKPLIGTVAANVLEYGVGGLNIDACRVPTEERVVRPPISRSDNTAYGKGLGSGSQNEPSGRFPPNLILTHSAECGDQCADDCPVAEIGRQSGVSSQTGESIQTKIREGAAYRIGTSDFTSVKHPGTGTAARYFPQFRYGSKISSADRETGNSHPTVKSTQLMRWLCTLITPPGGLILDPFMGSGSTGKAAAEDGFQFIGIEQDPESFATAEKRLNKATAQGLLC